MTIKIRQLVVKGNLSKESQNSEAFQTKSNSFDEKVDELKRYVDQTVNETFKQVCDSTAHQILEKIEKKSDF